MHSRLLLVCKRLFVIVLLIALTWFTVFMLFPFVDNRLPVVFAAMISYAFIAYVALPVTIRVWQALHNPTHVPTRTIAADGWAVDPINLVIIARSERDFMWAMQKAGWVTADTKTFLTSLRMVYAVLLNKSYPHAPFGNYYVFGRKQDHGFQIAIGKSPRHRHHVRFWRLGTTLLDEEHEHLGFWRRLLKKFTSKEKQIWVGSAVLDRGINLRWRNLQIDHGIVSDTTLERDYVVGSLQEAGILKDVIDVKAGEPLRTRHQGFGATIIADGYVKLCEIKRQILPPAESVSPERRHDS